LEAVEAFGEVLLQALGREAGDVHAGELRMAALGRDDHGRARFLEPLTERAFAGADAGGEPRGIDMSGVDEGATRGGKFVEQAEGRFGRDIGTERGDAEADDGGLERGAGDREGAHGLGRRACPGRRARSDDKKSAGKIRRFSLRIVASAD
jgi:hypothetical protein